MNEYKLAWYNETTAEFSPVDHTAKPNNSPSFAQQFKEQLKEDIKSEAAEYFVKAAVLAIGTHMAQSQIDGPLGMGLRTAGRVAIRAIPVVGAAYLAYSVYDAWND
jgi:hypothetical protein